MTKAAKGEARIFRRGAAKGDAANDNKGYWGCTWTAKMPDGSSKRIVLSAKSEEEIIAKRDAKVAELARGEYVSRNGITFETWATKWLKEYKEISLSPNTLETYGIMLKIHVFPRIGAKPLQKITNSDVQRCVNTVAKLKSPATVKKVANVVKQCFDQAVISRLIPFSPAQHIKVPRLEKVVKKSAFTDEELQRLIGTARDDKFRKRNPTFYPALLLMVETGCRRGEILGLKWTNVDTTNDTIKIQDTIVQVHGLPHEKKTPKNTPSIRTLPVSKDTMEAMVALEHNGDYIFHTRSGKPIAPMSFNKRFAHWCYSADLWYGEKTNKGYEEDRKHGHPTHTPHELRHTFITDMIDAGESIATIQSLTGHATPRVLVEYTHKVTESAINAVERRKSRLRKIVSKPPVVSNDVSRSR